MMRMVLTDLDHTLLRQDGSISAKTLSVLAACRGKGVRLAIATARYWIGAERYIRLLQPDYEITTDGTLLHAGEDCLYSCAFPPEETNQIISRILEAAPGAEITVAQGKTVYWNSRHIAESEKLHKAVYWDSSTALSVAANKIVAELTEEFLAREIAQAVGCRLQSYRGENWYSFLPQGAGKVSAIQELSRASGIPLAEFAAFGDDLNDLEMLRLCGTGVAVANAVPEVLAGADAVTLSNEEDGVAHWLEEVVGMATRGERCRCLQRERDGGSGPVLSGEAMHQPDGRCAVIPEDAPGSAGAASR